MIRKTASWLLVFCVLTAAPALSQQTNPQPDHSGVPGVVIDYSPNPARVYIGSPSIAVLPNGDYVASHDWFGPGTKNCRSAVFCSSDRGRTWKHRADIDGQWWSTLFVHDHALYIVGTSREWGDAVIRRSTDGGITWTTPKDGTTGLLAGGGQYHCAPVPVVVHGGRIWRAMEDRDPPEGWGRTFRSLVISAPADADLLNADNWTFSNRLHLNPKWLKAANPGWLEGNIVVTPENELVNILRVNDDRGDMAAIVRISEDGKTVSFHPENDFIDFPGGRAKFTIRYDPPSKRYWSLVNKQTNPPAYRNVLALTSSADLRSWRVESIVLRHVDGGNHAWQYVDWLFEGNDIIAVSRTAWDGSHRAHDANYLTFHRLKDFRDLTMEDSPPYLGLGKSVVHETAGLIVTGSGFRLETLDNDATAYGNRTYVWKRVPTRFQGWKFTQTKGGVMADVHVKAKRDLVLYVATATAQKGIDMTGWEPADDLQFSYTDKNSSVMAVFQKQLKAGDGIVVPQGNWSGTIVLIPPAGP